MSTFQPSVYVPPFGFRFDPTDEELVSHYLCRKINGEDYFELIEDMDVYSREPWNLPHKNNPAFKENEWFYFVKRSQASGSKNANGKRPKHTIEGDTNGGSWTAIEGDKQVVSKTGQTVGYKKTLTFYANKKKNGKGVKTDWIMKEYRLNSDHFQHLVLCKIRHKIKLKNTAHAVIFSPVNQEQDFHHAGDILQPLVFHHTSTQIKLAEIPCTSGIEPQSYTVKDSTMDQQRKFHNAGDVLQPLVFDHASPSQITSADFPSTSGIVTQNSGASGLNASVLESSASAFDLGCGQMELNDMNMGGTYADFGGDWSDEIFLSVWENGEILFD